MASTCDFQKGYILGIDMGTTSVKIVVVDVVTTNMVYRCSKSIKDSYLVFNHVFSEQCVQSMIAQLDQCVMSIPPDLAGQIIGIGICGQVHGVVCWSSTDKPWRIKTGTNSIMVDPVKPITPYYNWEDNRCDSKFLESLPKPDSHLTIHSGYGCCTLFWLIRNSPKILERLDRSATIADFVVAILCDLDTPKMTTQSAASWGYFKSDSSEWNREILAASNFPVHLLPEIVQPGTLAGRLAHSWHGIPAGTPVGTALGDMHAYVFAALEDDSYAICNISTSAQLVFVAKNFRPNSGEQKRTVAKIVPYFEDGQYLYEAAVLNGGNAVAVFVENLYDFVSQLHPTDDEDSLWKKLIEEAASIETDLNFSPTFLGERHSPRVKGCISNVKVDNFSMPQIFKALCRGVIINIRNIVSVETLKEKGITKIIGTGSALSRNRVLQMELEKCYHPLPVQLIQTAESPFGAAASVLKTLRTEKKRL